MDIFPIPGFSEPLSSWSHLIAALAAFVGLFYLCYRGRGSVSRITSLLVYSIALIFLFSMSGVYHLLDPEYLPRQVFQRLDHAGIWVLIAGTFTPIHIILFRGVWRWGVLGIIWGIGITGLVLEVIFFESVPEWLSISFYLGLGWIGLLTIRHFSSTYSDDSIRLMWYGGVCYTLGAILELVQWPTLVTGVVGPHEIFHLFVILGAAYHWLFIFKWASNPIRNRLVFDVTVYPQNRYVAKAIGELFKFEAPSVELLKEKIQTHIDKYYHNHIRPSLIRLKYSDEELL